MRLHICRINKRNVWTVVGGKRLKEIYAVMYAYYSDWQLYGYFTNREDAAKYCAVHPEKNCHVEILPCFDGQEDFQMFL